MRSGGYSCGLVGIVFSFFPLSFLLLPIGDSFVYSPSYLGLPLGALLLMNIFAFIHKKKKKTYCTVLYLLKVQKRRFEHVLVLFFF